MECYGGLFTWLVVLVVEGEGVVSTLVLEGDGGGANLDTLGKLNEAAG